MLEPVHLSIAPFGETAFRVKTDKHLRIFELGEGWITDPIFTLVGQLNDGLASARSLDGRYGMIDARGRWVIEPGFEKIQRMSQGLAAAQQDGKWGYIDRTGTWVIEPTFLEAHDFAEGMAAVKAKEGVWSAVAGARWGFIDQTGGWVLKPAFGDVRPSGFKQGLAIVTKGSSPDSPMGVIDRTGNWVVPPDYRFIGPFRDGISKVRQDDSKGLIAADGRLIVPPEFRDVDILDGAVRVMKHGKPGHYLLFRMDGSPIEIAPSP